MGSTIKGFHHSSKRSKGHRIIEGMDEEFGTYCKVLERPVEKRDKRPLNAFLKDIPLEARRREAGKPLYITRYE